MASSVPPPGLPVCVWTTIVCGYLDDCRNYVSNDFILARLDSDSHLHVWAHNEGSLPLIQNVAGVCVGSNRVVAWRKDGSTWDHYCRGKKTPGFHIPVMLKDIVHVYPYYHQFAAVTKDGEHMQSQYTRPGFPLILPKLEHVPVYHYVVKEDHFYFATPAALTLFREDISVIQWGREIFHVDLSGVIKIWKTKYGTYAGLRQNYTVVTWGLLHSGANSILPLLNNVRTIIPNDDAFAAIKFNGDVITWGRYQQKRSLQPVVTGSAQMW